MAKCQPFYNRVIKVKQRRKQNSEEYGNELTFVLLLVESTQFCKVCIVILNLQMDTLSLRLNDLAKEFSFKVKI